MARLGRRRPFWYLISWRPIDKIIWSAVAAAFVATFVLNVLALLHN